MTPYLMSVKHTIEIKFPCLECLDIVNGPIWMFDNILNNGQWITKNNEKPRNLFKQ